LLGSHHTGLNPAQHHSGPGAHLLGRWWTGGGHHLPGRGGIIGRAGV